VALQQEIEEDRLVSATEIADRLGLKDGQVVLDLRLHRVGFPAPIARRSRTMVWSWDDVEMWAITNEGVVDGPVGAALSTFLDRLD
jgi:hypothetical protein